MMFRVVTFAGFRLRFAGFTFRRATAGLFGTAAELVAVEIGGHRGKQ